MGNRSSSCAKAKANIDILANLPKKLLYDELSTQDKSRYDEVYKLHIKNIIEKRKNTYNIIYNSIGISLHIELDKDFINRGLFMDVNGEQREIFEPVSNILERLKTIFDRPFTMNLINKPLHVGNGAYDHDYFELKILFVQ